MTFTLGRQLQTFKSKLWAPITEVPDQLKPHHFSGLDGMRGLAILTVIIYHVLVGTAVGGWTDGTIGVHIFFIISGFLITSLLLKEKVIYGAVSFKKFYIRRSLRIIPVAYLYIFTLAILSWLSAIHLTFLNAITSLLYLKNFPTPATWETGHFWTLSIEEQFYLVVPFLLIANTNRFVKIIVVTSVLIQLIDYAGLHNIGIFYSNKIVHNITFILISLLDKGTLYILLGSLFSILVFKKVILIKRQPTYLSLLLLTAAFVIHFTYLVPPVPYISATAFAALIGFVIVLNLSGSNALCHVLSNPILTNIGKLSYSLYIWQQLFTLNQPWKGAFRYSDSIGLNLIGLSVVAYCSYRFYELRFLKLKNRFDNV